ncbi:glycosyltransferase family 2 protein [Thiohalomonas denitrificans]|uniref:Glycosyl transferase family 2 n=1 Tax=Thiohalomonas denitrificans TaxID=415747 RepID=A0A1G5Q2W6_9GAMM|nr:glycosyltransferase family A protein [Thiohalomonas denitrificans]SCZ55968.1 Glycosyl transferase family 2 [Thiohalomonas denitrificans]
MEPTVSVLIPTHNMGKHIATAISSALEQTYPVAEIIVVDDGSTDDTRQVMEQFREDGRVKYFQRDHMGQGKARNLTLELATGEFVAFLDADDLWTKDKLERQMPAFSADQEVGVVYSDVVVMDENASVQYFPKVKRYSGRITQPLFSGNFIPMSSAVARRRALDAAGGFSESLNMGLDYDLWLRVSVVWKFIHVPGPLLLWRSWGGQTCSHNFRGRHDSDAIIRKRFVQEFPGVVSKERIRQTEALSYLRRGINYLSLEGDRAAAALDFVKAIRFEPALVGAWKGLVKCILPQGFYSAGN